MKVYLFFFQFMLCLLSSCVKDSPGLPPKQDLFLLLNADSTSVITSIKDTISIDYRDYKDQVLRKVYSVWIQEKNTPFISRPWSQQGKVYLISWNYVEGDSLFIHCKGITDTLVIQKREPLTAVFNGEIVKKKADVFFLVR